MGKKGLTAEERAELDRAARGGAWAVAELVARGAVVSDAVAPGRPRPPAGVLDVEARCRQCGSPMVEQDAWAFVQLPFNDSEGIGRGYCGACEDDDAEFFIDGLTPEIIADWEEYREGNGLTSLREADDAFLTEARGQLAEFDIRRDRLAAEVAAWEVELRARPTPAGLVQADREGYE